MTDMSYVCLISWVMLVLSLNDGWQQQMMLGREIGTNIDQKKIHITIAFHHLISFHFVLFKKIRQFTGLSWQGVKQDIWQRTIQLDYSFSLTSSLWLVNSIENTGL